jgi:hypothetical protein
MAMPIFTAIVSVPLAYDVDLDTIATTMLVVLSAGVAWFLWRRK